MEDKRIQWHPAFCSAVRLELIENREDLEFYNEYNLNSKPLQADLLVIHKQGQDEIKNTIGKLFRKHNIMEYKAPKDGINIDSYFKTIAYACLYKASGKEINERMQKDITLSIVQERKPQKLFAMLRSEGYVISNPYKGIYYVSGKYVLFPTQFIISKELDKGLHVWLTSLTEEMLSKDAKLLIESTSNLSRKEDKDNADSLLNVAIRANELTFAILRREAPEMCEALEELMQPVIAEKLKKKEEEVTQQVTQQVTQRVTQQVTQQVTEQVTMQVSNTIAVKLLEDNMPIELIEKYTGLTREEIETLRNSI